MRRLSTSAFEFGDVRRECRLLALELRELLGHLLRALGHQRGACVAAAHLVHQLRQCALEQLLDARRVRLQHLQALPLAAHRVGRLVAAALRVV